MDQSYSDSSKKQPKGSWCLVESSIPVLGCAGGAEPPCSAGHSSRAAQSRVQGHRSGTAHVPCLTLGQGRSQPNPPGLNESGFGLSYLTPFHVPAFSEDALCHCGLLFSLLPLVQHWGLCWAQAGAVSSHKNPRYILRLRGGEHSPKLQREGREVPGAEPASSRACSIPACEMAGECGQRDGEEGSEG